MQGDFSGITFDPSKHYCGVLMQQGRVQLDSDWNTQWAIQTRAMRTALRDIIGAHGGTPGAFKVSFTDETLTVQAGAYYVEGIRAESRGLLTLKLNELTKFLVYLEVWERHVNVIEDPDVREVALLGAETCTRAQIAWAVKVLPLGEDGKKTTAAKTKTKAKKATEGAAVAQNEAGGGTDMMLPGRPTLVVQADDHKQDMEPCRFRPDASYRGVENQLYRVEIHMDDVAGDGELAFCFKWSRENGSVVFPILRCELPEKNDSRETTTVTVQLAHLGRDARYGLTCGDIVEFVDDGLEPSGVVVSRPDGSVDRGRSGALGCVLQINPERKEVVVEVYSGETFVGADSTLHPYLRRWEQKEKARAASSKRKKGDPHATLLRGAVPVQRTDLNKTWFDLEDGVQVRFGGSSEIEIGRSGDYWAFPARVATGDVVWPRVGDQPVERRPFNERHYAPLASVVTDVNGDLTVADARYEFSPIAKPVT